MNKGTLLIIFGFIFSFEAIAQNPFFSQLNVEANQVQARCIPFNSTNIEILQKEKINIKKITKNWIFFSASDNQFNKIKNPSIKKQLYKEFCPPAVLADSARALHLVDSVHAGTEGLPMPYTGKGVIIGYVDTGLDFNHPDFKNPDGSTRVLRYWDHSVNLGTNSYGYGTMWDSSHINAGTCTSIGDGHGTTVAGQGSGRGFQNDYNRGMAPESEIIIVETNFSLPNWTLTIADACDYIFKVADSLNMPAVVNLSLGTYLGSHDGNDPASELIENLLDEKTGRIVVCSAGNSGNQGKYHVQNTISTDTSFTWMIPNPSSPVQANGMFFDLWTDTVNSGFKLAIGADKVSPTYDFRGRTEFYTLPEIISSSVQDTIWVGSNRIATVQISGQLVNDVFNIRATIKADSTSYRYRIETFGSGKYDLWSGAFIGLSNFETNIPSTADYPAIANYVMPDSLQTIVSSWNCSEKVISVANVKNKLGYIDGNQNIYTSPDTTPRGRLAPSSSKGPARNQTIKPDISGAGDISLGPAPTNLWSNTNAFFLMDSSRRYIRNGGTSMASPVVAGIAALYLEKCPKSNYTDFKNHLINSSIIEPFMGTIPNFGYGYGTANALDLLLSTNFEASVVGPDGVCDSAVTISAASALTIDSIEWNSGANNLSFETDSAGIYFAEVFNEKGCKANSDTLTVVQFDIPTISTISEDANNLSVTSSESQVQWTFNGTDAAGETNLNFTISMGGDYSCYVINSDGCVAYSDTIRSSLSIEKIKEDNILIFPNPSNDYFSINSNIPIDVIEVIDGQGRITNLKRNGNIYSVKELSKGTYTIKIKTKENHFFSRFVKP